MINIQRYVFGVCVSVLLHKFVKKKKIDTKLDIIMHLNWNIVFLKYVYFAEDGNESIILM